MSLAPSTYYYRPRARSAEAAAGEARLIARIREICAEFPRGTVTAASPPS
jgi:hypothetical protein